MKNKNTDIRSILDISRDKYPNSQFLSDISQILIAKVLNTDTLLRTKEDIQRIIHETYPAIESPIMLDNEILSKILELVNQTTVPESLINEFFSASLKSHLGISYDFTISGAKDLARLVKIPVEGKIADLNANCSTLIKEVIKQNHFKGEVHLFSKNPASLRLALLNLLPITSTIILHLGDLSQLKETNSRFEFIYAMPPLGLRLSDDPTKEIIALSKDRLTQRGKLALLLGAGFLFNTHHKETRENILQSYHVDAIINLSAAFKPYTGIESSIILLDNSSSNLKTFVAEINFLDETFEDVKVVVDAYYEHIRGKTLKNTSPLTNRIDQKELFKDFTVKRFDPKLIEMEESISKNYKIVRLVDICEIIKPSKQYETKDYLTKKEKSSIRYIRIQDLKDGLVTLSTAKDVMKKKQKDLITRGGDVLISTSGTIGKLAVVDKRSQGTLLSQGLSLLRVKKNVVDPDYLHYALKSSYVLNQLKNFTHGAYISHLSTKDLEEIRVPILPITKQREVTRKIKKLNLTLQRLKREQQEIEKRLQASQEVFF